MLTDIESSLRQLSILQSYMQYDRIQTQEPLVGPGAVSKWVSV